MLYKLRDGTVGQRLPEPPPPGYVRTFFDADGVEQVMDSEGTITPRNAWLGNRGMAEQDPADVMIPGGSVRATKGLGFAATAVGSVTQTTSKSTSVTLDDVQSMNVTMSSASLANNTPVSFTLNCNQIGANDKIDVSHHSGGTVGHYDVDGRATGTGTAQITVIQRSGGSLGESIVLAISIIKRTA